MPRSLTFKLVAAFIGVSLVAIGLVALFGSLAAANEFNRFVSQEATNNFYAFVNDYYLTNGNLDHIDDALRLQFQRSNNNPDDRPRLFPSLLTEPDGEVVIGGDGFIPGDRVPPTLLVTGTRIISNGQLIAIAIPRQGPPPRNRAQEEYLQRTGVSLVLAVGGASLVALLLGLLLARTITKPLLALTEAARRVARGQFGQTVQVKSRDEVGELAIAFNTMSTDLAQADRTRRQMTADIAHELRNPLTVIGGYLEAMRSGDLQPTPTRLDTVYNEIQHLERIVEDLRTLSLAEAGALILNLQPVMVDDLLRRVAARYAPQTAQNQIALTVEAPQAMVRLDEARITQVLDNLLSNAFKHTLPGGRIQLTGMVVENAVRLSVADTGEGISAEDLPRVFERFYRADAARPDDEESSGLGLAIAKALVEAHGGRIWVASSPGEGATFTVELPLGSKEPPPGIEINSVGTSKLAPAL